MHRPRFQLGMELTADEPRVIGQLDYLHQRAVGREPSATHPILGQDVAVRVVHFVAVTVPFADLLAAVDLGRSRAGPQAAGVRSEPHGTPHVLDVALRIHERDHRILALRLELAGVGLRQLAHVAGELDHRHLEPQTDAEERQVVLARPAHRLHHPLDAALSEAARHEQCVVVAQQPPGSLLVRKPIAGDPLQIDAHVIGGTAVDQRLVDRLVSVGELGVLADDRYPHAVARLEDLLDHRPPRPEVGVLHVEAEPIAHQLVEFLLVEQQWNLIDGLDVVALDHEVVIHVAEQGDLALD